MLKEVEQLYLQPCISVSNYDPAFFGGGTKLTVLESGINVTPPKVRVFPPSIHECRNKKEKTRKKTLVCVADKFYPDHVTVSWKINEIDVTEGVATDTAAQREGNSYKITSRLRVRADDWFETGNTFTCIVKFFNGTNTVPTEIMIRGVKAPEDGTMTKRKYVKITQRAKLSYSVFIMKSCMYGAFVAFLVWKLQGPAGK